MRFEALLPLVDDAKVRLEVNELLGLLDAVRIALLSEAEEGENLLPLLLLEGVFKMEEAVEASSSELGALQNEVVFMSVHTFFKRSWNGSENFRE